MIHYLLLFQFAFLYCMSGIIGLVVYGSNFDDITTWMYLFPLVFIPTFQKWIYPFIAPVLKQQWQVLIFATGAVISVSAYKPLHFAFWDEHSLSQTLLVSLTGVFSYFASVYGASRVRQWQGRHSVASVSALLIIALIWLGASVFPMIPLFAVGLVLAIAVFWPVDKRATGLQYQVTGKLPDILRPGYLMFLILLDLSLIIWDFQTNNQWAYHIACAFFMTPLGYIGASNSIASNNQTGLYGLIFVVILNIMAGVIWPGWLLMLPHTLINGVLLGVLCRYFINSHSGEFQPRGVLSITNFVVWGMVFGYLFYANLDYVQWRVVFLLLYILMLYKKRSTFLIFGNRSQILSVILKRFKK